MDVAATPGAGKNGDLKALQPGISTSAAGQVHAQSVSAEVYSEDYSGEDIANHHEKSYGEARQVGDDDDAKKRSHATSRV